MKLVTEQLGIFMGAWVLGMAFAVLYDLLVAIRRTLNLSVAAVSVLDFLFAVILGTFSFLYMLASVDGRIRGFILIGELLGALLYKTALSDMVLGALTAILGFFWAVTVAPVAFVLKKFQTIIDTIISRIKRSVKTLQSFVPKKRKMEGDITN